MKKLFLILVVALAGCVSYPAKAQDEDVSRKLGLLYDPDAGNLVTPTNVTYFDLSITNTLVSTNLTDFIRAIRNYTTTNYFTTGYGITNKNGILSNNIIAGPFILITNNPYGQLVVAVSGLTNGGSGITNVTETMLSFSDNTIANADTNKHGLATKLSGDTNTFLRGDGVYVQPLSYSLTDLYRIQNPFGPFGPLGPPQPVSMGVMYYTTNGGNSFWTQAQASSTNNIGQVLQSQLSVFSGPPELVFDYIRENSFSFSDNVTNNASVSKHGLLTKLEGTTNTVLHGDGAFSASGMLPALPSNSSLYLDGSGNWSTPPGTGGGGGGGSSITAQVVFNITTSWTCPVGVTNVLVEAWGAGGDGSPGNGGGGGEYVRGVLTLTPGSAYSIYVGRTYTGSVDNDYTLIQNGSGTILLRAYHGQPGYLGGAGGSSSTADGFLHIAGSVGSNTSPTVGGNSPLGGAGGMPNSLGLPNGNIPGGGGGGRTSISTANGTGARGMLIIRY